MIVKFFHGGSGASARSSIDYLLGKDRKRYGAKIIKGDPELSLLIAESCNFNHNYSVGCLSFEEQELSEELKKEIIAEFEKTFFSGLDDDQFNISWIEHTDKNRVELNFFIPKVELRTQKQLVPYFHKSDFQLADSFKKVINHKHNLTNPDDPAKTQLMKNDKKLSGSDKEIKEFLMSAIVESFANGTIENRTDITNSLKELNLEITRETKKSISIKSPESNKNIRLDGEIFKQDFDFNQTVNRLEIDKNLFELNKNKDYEKSLKTLSDFTAKRRNDFTKKYSTTQGTQNEHIRDVTNDQKRERPVLDRFRAGDVKITQEHTTRTRRSQQSFQTRDRSNDHETKARNRNDDQETNTRSNRSDSITDTSIRRESNSTANLEKITTATADSVDYNNDLRMLSSTNQLRSDQRKINENRATELSRSTKDLSRNLATREHEQIKNIEQRERDLSIDRQERWQNFQESRRRLNYADREIGDLKNEQNFNSINQFRNQTALRNELRILPVCGLDERTIESNRQNYKSTSDSSVESVLLEDERSDLQFTREKHDDNDRLRSVSRLSVFERNTTAREQIEDVFNRIKELVKQLKSAIERSFARDREIAETRQATERTEQTIADFTSKIDESSREVIEIERSIGTAKQDIDRTKRNIDTTEQSISTTKRNIERTDNDCSATERYINESEQKTTLASNNQNNRQIWRFERDADDDFDR